MWYLSLSQLFYISATDDIFGHFFLSTKWENANTGQSLSSSVPSLPDMWATSPMEKIPWGRSVWKHLTAMFEGGNLLNMNLTPVTNIPWNSATSWVVRLSCRAIFANISQIYYFIFEGIVSICIFLLQLGSICNVCVQHNMGSMCTHKKKIGRSCLKFIIVSAWS